MTSNGYDNLILIFRKESSKMAKKKASNKDKQGTLIDVGPKNSKELDAALAPYDEHKLARMAEGKLECEHKEIVLALVAESGLKPNEKGLIVFTTPAGFVVEVEPGKPKLKVTAKKPDEYDE